MYDLINAHIQAILGAIPQKYVTEYDWLIQNVNQCETPEYQARYKNFWRLNAARLSANYCNFYFQVLRQAQINPPAVGNLAQQLHNTPTYGNGRQSLQFSFATKLLHMVNPNYNVLQGMVITPCRSATMGTGYLFLGSCATNNHPISFILYTFRTISLNPENLFHNIRFQRRCHRSLPACCRRYVLKRSDALRNFFSPSF